MTKNPEELLQKIKQLESELKKVKSCKRYGLVWEDKPEIFEEKAKNALPILQEDKNLRIEEDENKPNNIIIEGDNYHSLSALSYTHKGKIDVIYIDPPYNTGNKDFTYNDNYIDEEDPFKHTKWLSFINKRLRLAKDLLSEKGLIFISINDHEQAQLKLLGNDIFGEQNFIGNLIWTNKEGGGSSDSKHFKIKHEYILIFGKNKEQSSIYGLEQEEDKSYNGEDEYVKERGKFKLIKLNSFSIQYSESLDYEIEYKGKIYHASENGRRGCWRWSKKKFEWGLKNDFLIIKNGNVYTKQYFKVDNENRQIKRTITPTGIIDLYSSTMATKQLDNIFGFKAFSYSKPFLLIKYLFEILGENYKNSTILDFFAGSGTTGHAVMELNKEDGGNRQFILCSSKENTKSEPDKNICKDITYERNKRVIEGYINSKGDKIEGLGGHLRYYTNEFIKADKSIDDLRYNFIDMCDDLLCIKENTFTEVKLKNSVPELRLFKKLDKVNSEGKEGALGYKYTAILYDIHHFKDLIKLLEVLDGQISVYIFSLSKDIFEEELEHLNKDIIVQNIPDDILQTYKKIFNF